MMGLPVLPLSSLAFRVVLAKDLDTRELPLHLHSEIEQYRRLEGVFTLLQVDYKVERVDGGDVKEEDREVAKEFFLETIAGKMILSCDAHVDHGNNQWCMRKAEEQRSATVHIQNPVDILNNNIIYENSYKKSYRATYLEGGKLIMLERNTLLGLKNGQENLVNMIKESFEVDPAGRLAWVQKFEVAELVFSFTNSGARAQRGGETRAVYGDDEEWLLSQGEEETSSRVL